MPDAADNFFDPVIKKNMEALYGEGKLSLTIDSIEPEGGPITGNTRVLVRGGPFKDMEGVYPHPKCKFGKFDLVVDATYVSCTTSPTAIEEQEARRAQKVKIHPL